MSQLVWYLGTFGDALEFIVDRRALLLDKTWEHVLLSGAAMGVALVLAVPLGVWLGHLHRGSFVAINLANVGRALPSLAVIAIGLGIFGFGFTNVLVALVILAVPLILTNAYVAVNEVERDAVEAARGMGMTPWQIVRRVELPLALPLLFAGIRTAAVYVVATATIAAIAGGGGLGEILFNQASYRTEGLVGAAIVVSALAFAADAAFGLLQRLLTPRGLARRGAGARARRGDGRALSSDRGDSGHAAAGLVAAAAARLVLLVRAHHDRLARVRRGLPVDEPLRRRRRAAAAMANGLELVDELGVDEQRRHGAEREPAEVLVEAGGDDADADVGERSATTTISSSKNCTSSMPTTSAPAPRASSSAPEATGTPPRAPAWLTTSAAS